VIARHGPEPHRDRRRLILKAHPELRALFGRNPWSALLVVTLVAAQLVVAVSVAGAAWWVVGLSAYVVGAVLNHGLWVLIHECTHDLVFRTPTANRVLQIVANLPIVMPASISFRRYHLEHHRNLNQPSGDTDAPSPLELRLFGNSPPAKAFWLLTFTLWQTLRIFQVRERIKVFDGWVVTNLAVVLGFTAAFAWWVGAGGVLYLALSTAFGIGLHPLGARWIQEHFVVHGTQETSSYHGPANLISFNVGYHVEHHDLPGIPWNRLPRVRAIAGEFYAAMYSHGSWTRLLLRFVFDRQLSLRSRVLREPPADEDQHLPRLGAADDRTAPAT
jgi:sphingolipid 4-desaturase/C4-monooxygenase